MTEKEEILREENMTEDLRQDDSTEKKARRKKLAGFGLRLVCFAVITVLLLT